MSAPRLTFPPSHKGILAAATCVQLAVVSLVGAAAPPEAREPGRSRFEHLTERHGLSDDEVTALLQDRTGYLWVGTQDGLNRYDGRRFRVYRHRGSDSTSLPYDIIEGLGEDREGALWIATRRGLARYDRARDRFRRYDRTPGTGQSSNVNRFGPILEFSSGDLLLGSLGLAVFDRRREAFTDSIGGVPTAGIGTSGVTALFEHPAGTAWIGTRRGLYRLRPDRGELRYERLLPDTVRAGYSTVTAFARDSLGRLWIGTWGQGIFRYESSTDRYAGQRLPGAVVRALIADPDSSLWIATADGLFHFDAAGRLLSRSVHDPQDVATLRNSWVSALVRDRSGILWAGTFEGLSKLDPRAQRFPWLTFEAGSEITAIAQDGADSALWIATFGAGVCRLDLATGRRMWLRHDPANPFSPASDRIRQVYLDRAGRLWMGGLGVSMWNGSGFVRWAGGTPVPDRLRAATITRIAEAPDGTLWFATWGDGVYRFSPSGTDPGRFARYQWIPTAEESVDVSITFALAHDRQGRAWIGTESRGLVRFDPRTDEAVLYRHRPGQSGSIPSDNINDLQIGRDGTVWLATQHGGLCALDPATGTGRTMTADDGLSHNFLWGIEEGPDSCIWLTTRSGLNCVDPRSSRVVRYDRRDGLPAHNLSGDLVRTSWGELLLPHGSVIVRIVPDRLRPNPYVPPIAISSIRLFHRDATGVDLSDLPPSSNMISFEFAALSYTVPEKNQYAYRLEGFDEDWIFAGDRTSATYANLAPGTYTFRVKGSNNDGVWNTAGNAVQFTITPPVWRRPWLQLLAGLLVIVAAAAGYRRQTLRSQREQSRQKEFSRGLLERQERERRRIAKELHDSLGQNLLVVHTELQRSARGADPALQRSLQEIAGMVVGSINEIRTISTDLHPHQLERLGFRKAAEGMIERLAGASGIAIEHSLIDIDRLLPRPAWLELYRILQEALSNVIRYSQARSARVWMRWDDAAGLLEMGIEDSGVGFERGTVREGLGIRSMEERAALLGGALSLQSTPHHGTTIQVQIPARDTTSRMQ